MNKKLARFTLVLIAVTTFGCAKQNNSIEGKWVIDLDPMIQQAKSLGASTKGIQEIRDVYADGKLEIDNRRITLTIIGVSGNDVKEYQVVSKNGTCTSISYKATNEESKYCVAGSRLEVHDPNSKLITVYRKS